MKVKGRRGQWVFEHAPGGLASLDGLPWTQSSAPASYWSYTSEALEWEMLSVSLLKHHLCPQIWSH
jgi:hypothetical protein